MFPFNVQWMIVEGDVPCRVMIVVPKRKFKHAVDRNRIRRLTRECYRLQKLQLIETLQNKGLHIAVSIVYVHNEMTPYEQLFVRMRRLIDALIKETAAL